MLVRVLMFASLAQRTGVREEELDLPDSATVGDAVSALSQRHPAIRDLHNRLAFAVNMSYVKLDQRLAPGDELALIPPVSGG